MKRLLTGLWCLAVLAQGLNSQVPTQNIRGTVVDASSGYPLIGAAIVVPETEPVKGTVTNTHGEFMLHDIPVGRVSIHVRYVGYETAHLQNLLLNSGKELILNIALKEDMIQTEEVVIKAHSRKDQPLNEMAMVSARSFTIEETERYAGSWGDPARMATSFAGVMVSSDQTNDIIIRGNSPQYMNYMLEGIDIPNPSHFGGIGQTGGPISMLNNNTLSNSDFFTGAFPAEYGNALSGVFDLQLRTGNNQKREYLAQVGFNGFEAGIEGPFVKGKNATYIANYRYSVMGTLEVLGIDIGIGAVPYYNDFSFKINLPRTKAGGFSLFGIYGHNHIAFTEGMDSLGTYYYSRWKSDVFMGGLSHRYFFNENARIETTLGVSSKTDNGFFHFYEYTPGDSLNFLENKQPFLIRDYGDFNQEIKYTLNTEYKKKIDAKNDFLTGITVDYITASYVDSMMVPSSDVYFSSLDTEGSLMLYRLFGQWMHRFTDQLTWIGGLHVQSASVNNEISVEPRTSLRYKLNAATSLSMGYGLHSQLQPRLIYFQETLIDTAQMQYAKTNEDLGFSKSHHIVLGVDHLFKPDLRLKTELYYQHLYNIPVHNYPDYFSLINYGSSAFSGDIDSLVNEGTARNYGVEFTLEQFFNKQYYYLVTASLFDSKYRGSDGHLYNSLYNGNWVFNALGGYEFALGKDDKNALIISGKAVWAGGLRKVKLDVEASRKVDDTVYDYTNPYTTRNPDYYKIDLRLAFRLNTRHTTTEMAIDVINVTNHKNAFITYWSYSEKKVVNVEMGIVPMATVRVSW